MGEAAQEEDELEALVYGLIAERDRERQKVGRLEAIIEEVKALAAKYEGNAAWAGLPEVAASLREILEWPDKQEFYDNSWRKKFYPEEEQDE